ncbi:MAG TPA: DUF2569 domain-containing protein [Holophagaceae bacterium]|nr:DUF2569 domain-containing protein [Holophagaceae bacterium]
MTPIEDNPYAAPEAQLVLPTAERGPDFAIEGPSGLGGWLVLPMLGLIFRPIIVLGQLTSTFLPLFSNGTWAKVTTPSSKYYHPLWAPLLTLEIVYNILILGFCLYVAVHFFRRSVKTPRLYILLLVVIPAFLLVDQVLAGQIPNLPKAALDKNLGALGGSIVTALVWVPYFLNSVRVRNTFIH